MTGELEKRTVFRGDIPLDMLDVESSSARRGGVTVGDSFRLGTRRIRDTLICNRVGNIEADADRCVRTEGVGGALIVSVEPVNERSDEEGGRDADVGDLVGEPGFFMEERGGGGGRMTGVPRDGIFAGVRFKAWRGCELERPRWLMEGDSERGERR